MNKLFVLNGGAAVKPGAKGAYLQFDDPLVAFRKGGINTGDVLVYDAMLKELDYGAIRNLQFVSCGEQNLWPAEGSYDATVVRGSNYLTETVDLANTVPLLKALKGPIVGIGIGAQAEKYRKLNLTKGTIEAWKIIADKCETIGVRGFYSAEIFNDIGIKNVRVIGCPSFYRGLAPELKIRPLNPANARIGLTLNKYLSAEYASNAIKTNRLQRELVRQIAQRPSSRFYSQGEREETLAIFSTGQEKQDNVRSILSKFKLVGNADAEEMLNHRMSAFFDVDQWAADAAANVDVMVGLRLHGNVIALHQGIPAVFFTYDTRIRELASLFSIPAVEIEEFMPVKLETMLERADFSKFETAYRLNYAEYHRFLQENKLKHIMPAPVTAPVVRDLSQPNRIDVPVDTAELTAWHQSETDFMTAEIETLRSRAWNLEIALRKAKTPAAQPTPALKVAV